jgi:hypothetical protein
MLHWKRNTFVTVVAFKLRDCNHVDVLVLYMGFKLGRTLVYAKLVLL